MAISDGALREGLLTDLIVEYFTVIPVVTV